MYGEENWLAFPKYEDVVCGVECYRYYVVYKISLGMFLYYAVQAVALLGITRQEQPRSVIHEGFWPAKMILLIASILGCCYLPRWLLDYAFYPALFASIFFLLAQSILLVDFAWGMVENLLEAAEESAAWSWLLIGMTLGMYSLMGTGSVFLFLWYPDNWSRAILILNATLAIILSVLGILPAVQEANPSAGIFQSSLLGLYGLFLVCSAILSNPANHTPAEGSLATVMKIGAFSFACLCVLYSARNTGKHGHAKLTDSESDAEKGDFNYSWYHLTFASASLYMALIASGWHLVKIEGTAWMAIDAALAWWVKTATAATIYLLYGWSLFAPMIFPDREF